MAETQHLQVDPSNQDQARAWDGDQGAYWVSHADRFDRSVAAYQRPFLDSARVGVTDQVLDIGCGTGQTTRDVARLASAGRALGVDLSEAMIAYARRRAAADHLPNAHFAQADAQTYPFPDAGFDIVVSRTGAMFFGAPDDAFANIGRALVRGGRLSLLTWRAPHDNQWFLALTTALAAGRPLPAPPPDAPGPFSLSAPDRIHRLLTGSGFTGVAIDALDAPMWFGAIVDDAATFVLGLLGWMLDGLDGHQRGRAVDELHATVAAQQTADGVAFGSGTWLVTARRA